MVKKKRRREKTPQPVLWKYGTVVALASIALTALIVYSNTFSSPFLFDDELYIVDNLSIRDLSNFTDLSGTRYLGYLSFAVNYALGGYSTFGYHLVNTAVHILNGVLVWLLVTLAFKTPVGENAPHGEKLRYPIALIAALVFVAHPVQTQAVTYITQRFASIATFFYLLSLVCYIKARLLQTAGGVRGRDVIFTIAALVSAVLAMKTKEISFTLPFIIMLFEFVFFYDGTPLKKRALYLSPFLLTLLIVPLSLFTQEAGGAGGESFSVVAEKIRRMQVEELATLSRHDYLATQFSVIVTYLRLLVLPVGQRALYDYTLYHSFFEPRVMASFIFLSAVFLSAAYLLIRSRQGGQRGNAYPVLASFGVLWFFITVSVESSIVPIKDIIFEHRVYLPSVGMAVAFATASVYGVNYLRPKVTALRLTAVILVLVVLPLSAAAFKRNLVWRGAVPLWEDTSAKSPRNTGVYMALGLAYFNEGRTEEAIENYKEAIRRAPNFAEARNNLANAYNKLGRLEEAVGEYREALKINPDAPDVHFNLGIVYHNMGRMEEAVGEYRESIRLNPYSPKAQNNLGNSLYALGRMDEAREAYKESVRLDPGYAEAYNNLGNVYYRTGELDNAIAQYKEAARLKPDYAGALFNLGLAYQRKGLIEEAIEAFEGGLKIVPDDEKARTILRTLKQEQ